MTKRRTILETWQGDWLRVDKERVELPNGHEIDIDIVKHPGAACIVPFTSDDEVLLIRQFRPATDGEILEFAAGKLEPGELPEACALRELEEETGYSAGRIEHLSSIWTAPGFTDEVIHLYAAFDLEPVGQSLQEDEVIDLVPVRLAEALELVFSGALNDAKSAVALLIAAKRLGRLG
ncbi:MAG: NUDIX hydrolase [Myxococcota bacterium]|nr:NUDIX hydrolase [Myxococcota bacterium]